MTSLLEPDGDDDFISALARLIEHADSNGIDVEGGWKVATEGNGNHFWDVQITTVQYASDDDD